MKPRNDRVREVTVTPTFSMPASLLAAIDKAAAEDADAAGNRSVIARRALRYYLKELEFDRALSPDPKR